MSTGPAAAPAKTGEDKMQQAQSKTNIDGNRSNTTDNDELVRKCDLRPHDVLMGRGHFNHPGNDRFLQIVSERQADYRAAKFTDKQQIATEVLELVLDPTHMSGGGEDGSRQDETTSGADGPTGLLPPARFLQLESGDKKSDDCTFRIVSGKAVDAKVKMALRQKKFQANKRSTSSEEATNAAFTSEGNGAQLLDDTAAIATTHGSLDPTKGVGLPDDEGLMSSLGRYAEEDGSMNSANQMMNGAGASGKIVSSVCVHAAVGRNALSSYGGCSSTSSASLASDRSSPQQLLPFLRAAQETVRPLREKYHGTSISNEICADLHSLGKVLYRMLAMENGGGSTSSTDVNMRSGDDSEEPLAKRERRRGEVESGRQALEGGRFPLQDLGYPSTLSVFVQSLIDATDEDASDRFQSILDVDNDLRLMIEYPDKYLLEQSQEVFAGTFNSSSKLYGMQEQQNKLINAFQSVFVTGEEPRGLVLISGQSGTGKVSSSSSNVRTLQVFPGLFLSSCLTTTALPPNQYNMSFFLFPDVSCQHSLWST